MSLRSKALSGMVWTFAQQFSLQGIQFLVTMVLARILLPSEFGIIGMISVFIAISNSVMTSGLTLSLIRTEEPDQEDYSTVFFFNVFGSLFMYAVLFFCAPLIADFYSQPILVDVLRLYCLTFVINSFSAVQTTRLTKAMDFKTQMMVSVPSLVVSGLLGIVLAYMGFGVWALVWMAILQAFFNTIQLWIRTGWVPSPVFSKEKFKYHFGFGYKLGISGLLNTIFTNIYQIMIGKFYAPALVGFYTRADQLRQLPVTNISTALNKVTYPLFASIQNDDIRLRKVYSKIMKMVIFVIAPVLIIMAVLAQPLFRFLFTEKWLPAVPYFQIMCIGGILYPIHAYNLNILKVKGRSDLFLKLEVIKRILTVLVVASTITVGIKALLWGQVISSILAFFINTHYSGKILKYTAWDQVKDILPIILVAGLTGILTFGLDFTVMSQFVDVVRLFTCGVFSGIVYLALNYFFNRPTINYFLAILKKK